MASLVARPDDESPMRFATLASSFVLVLAVVTACGDDESPSDGPLVLPTTPAVTDVGVPSGNPVTKTLGPAGGTIASADGKIEIVIPEGALAAETEISITPLSATGPGAFAAWRLGPEGTTFAAPVTVRVVASDDDLAGSGPEALRIGTQRPDRTWGVVKDATIDGKTIAVQTTHFSDWAALLGWQLRPGSAKVKTGETQRLDVRYCHYVATEEQELVGVMAECQDNDLAPMLGPWAVNGVNGGSSAVGTVTPSEATGTYTAPSTVPDANPVAVSVEFNPLQRAKVLLVSNIDVVGGSGYSGTFSFTTKQDSFDLEGTDGTVQWTLTNENSDRHEYKPSGTVRLKYTSKSPQCQPVEGVYPIEEGELVVHRPGAAMFASQYTFNVRLAPKVTLQCTGSDGKPFTTDFQIPAIIQVGFCDGATMPTYADESTIAGSGSCPVVGVESSTWSFTKQ